MLQYRVCSQEIQRNAEETHASKNDVLSQNKDLEKKIKILEADLVQCQANISAAERARQFAENEREKLAKKLSNASLALEEKKRLDVRWGRALRFIFVKNIWKIFASQSNCAKMVSKLGILRFIL
jgi:chromosome segregation ATPase